jgi:hypothetical protein
MKSFKELKSSLVEQKENYAGLKDKDIVFDIDNNDVEDVLDTAPDTLDDLEESAIDTIKDIVKNKSAKPVKFEDGKTMKVDLQTANVILKVVDALNDANKKKFSAMLGKNKANFTKAVDFAWGAVK